MPRRVEPEFLLPDGPCVADRPRSNHIKFHGRFINLTRVREATHYSHSSIVKIFHGDRTPSLEGATQIAKALKITVEQLQRGLEIRKKFGNNDLSLT